MKLTAKDYTYDHQAFKDHQLPFNFTIVTKRIDGHSEASLRDKNLVYIGLGKTALEATAQLLEILNLVAFTCQKNKTHCFCRLTRFHGTGTRSRALECCNCKTKVRATRVK